MVQNISKDWSLVLKDSLASSSFKRLWEFLEFSYQNTTIYPPADLLFSALNLSTLDNIKVIILGQDPYHTPGIAHGLSFSSVDPNYSPPSLRNIFKEIKRTHENIVLNQTNLTPWAKRGVLLLNTILSVEKGKAKSHHNHGWEPFTTDIIEILSKHHTSKVFMLWGKQSQKFSPHIDQEKHLILESAHPSPLSAHRGFIGCNHFVLCNQFLKKRHRSAIDWSLK